ncbi:B3 domain-containing protein REM16 [Medicago truncatula]|uniref:B3 domain-containing protein REM16 n=1 Tax=Medicago truncatula TaxID=3880 RepID=UPI00014FDC92|nr:B3 domain-containing protein REM16 [Medicago truncatula]
MFQMGSGRRSREEEIYWNHFQFIHFTLFLSTTHFQQQLALPKTFSDNLKKKLPENVTLKGPSGVVWNIGLTTRNDTVYFMDGWQRFVKDHSLKENDFLVFKYNGESLFEVLIFNGESLCEKAASYFVLECGQAHTEQGGNKGKNSNNFFEEVNTPS